MSNEPKIYRRVRVWNDHTEDFRHVVKGERREIPAGGFIEVSRSEGQDIKGFYPGKAVITKLRIEPLYDAQPEKPAEIVQPERSSQTPTASRVYACTHCDLEFSLKGDMMAHYDKVHKRGRKAGKDLIDDSGAGGN